MSVTSSQSSASAGLDGSTVTASSDVVSTASTALAVPRDVNVALAFCVITLSLICLWLLQHSDFSRDVTCHLDGAAVAAIENRASPVPLRCVEEK